MSRATLGCGVCGRMECGGYHAAPEDRIGELRGAAEANWRRRQRKLAVYKAGGAIGLTFLICASLLAVAYGFHV